MKLNFELAEIKEVFLKWLFSLSERSLLLIAITGMHLVFLPQMYAYLNNKTEVLPNLDAYLVVLFVTVCMNLRAILKKDQVSQLVHMIGFVAQLVIGMLILLK